MKKGKIAMLCILLSGSIMFSSCIGSFRLWNNLKTWNQNVSDKFVNELVFLAFHIIPVYEIAYLADVIVINAIEFWSGENPIASVGEQKQIKGDDGMNYTVTTTKNGYTITKEGEDNAVDLVFNSENKSWNAIQNGMSYELVQMNDDGTVTLSMKDGEKLTVTPDAQGIETARVAATGAILQK